MSIIATNTINRFIEQLLTTQNIIYALFLNTNQFTLFSLHMYFAMIIYVKWIVWCQLIFRYFI